jgi:hypothetical protein
MGAMHHAGSLNGSPVNTWLSGTVLSTLENNDVDALPTRTFM